MVPKPGEPSAKVFWALGAGAMVVFVLSVYLTLVSSRWWVGAFLALSSLISVGVAAANLRRIGRE